MSKLFNDIQPGDLIMSSFWNQVLHALNSFDDRISALEAIGSTGGGLTISGIFPPSPVHIGDTVTILGRGFGVPSSNSVNIDGTPVGTLLAGSNDSQLILKIPNLQGIPQAGKFVTLTVANPSGSATLTFLLLQGQPTIPTGTLQVNMSPTKVSPPDPLILAGKPYIFTFTVTAITSMDEVYTVTPSVSSGWTAALVDGSGNAITPSEVSIPKGDPPNGISQDIRIMVASPLGAGNGVSSPVTVTVTAKHNSSVTNFGSSPTPMTVGSPPPGGQDQVIVSFDSIFAPGTQSAGTIKIPPTNNQIRVDFKATIKDIGTPVTYNIAAPTIQPPSALWTAQLKSAAQINTPGSHTFSIALAAQPNAPAANVVVSVSSTSGQIVTGQVSQPIIAG
ncbi:MAG: hypothetical protein ACXV5J_03400 [Candidatus Angelobacter sp.]